MFLKKILINSSIVLLGTMSVCGQSILREPESAKSRYERASEALKKGDADAAILNYTAAISENEQNAGAWAGRGAARRLKGDFEGALADLTRSIELNPNVQSSYYTRAWVNLILGRGGEAYADATRLLAFNESNTLIFPSHVLIAYFGLRQAKRDSEAESFIRNALPKLFSGASTTQIARYLKRDLSEDQLFASSNGPRAMTEARSYVGLDESLNGRREAALVNLRWVIANADKRAFEYSLAIAEIRRQETTPMIKPLPKP